MYKILKETSVVTTTVVVEEMEATLFEYIGYKLKTRREELGLKIADVARATLASKIPFRGGTPGISQSSISSIEKGTANPNVNSLDILCDILKLHISELFPPKQEPSEVLEITETESAEQPS